jgi:hypothetical protein
MSDPLELISGYLDHDLSDAEVAELEAWILADPNHAAIFARRATVHSQIRDALAGEISLQLSQLRSPELFEPIEEANDFETQDEVPGSMSDAMIMQALVESDFADEPAPIELPRNAPFAEQQVAPRQMFARGRMIRIVGSVAAVLLLSLGLTIWWIASRPVALLTASVGSVWEQAEKAPTIGEALSSGQTLRLAQGFAEFKYPSGAKIVIEAPATFVLNSRDRVTLLHGRLTALIPTPAHGFTVSTPAGKVVDLGTEFGVNVISESVVETQVFKGRVQVQTKDDTNAALLVVTAGQGAHLSSSGASLEPTAANSQQYVRDIHQVVATLPTHGTAQGLEEGDQDPYWELTSIPNDPYWRPRPAVASDRLGFYAPNDSRAAWVSTEGNLVDVDAGHYTFTTTFDLSGFNPSSAHLRLNLSADDNIAEIRLNGIALSIPTLVRGQLYRSMHPLDISSGFLPGVNEIDIVVNNAAFSKVALKAELDGTALREVDSQ